MIRERYFMKSASILIIEDDAMLSNQIASLMHAQGFRTKQFNDGEKGLFAALREKFDLILLDIQLPGLDGFSILDKLRKRQQTPVMILTGCNAENERINGYKTGADDYVSKPVNATELQLRIQAILRRTRWQAEPTQTQNQLQLDELSLDRQTQDITYDGTQVELTSIQFKLLWTLVENRNEVLNKPYLYQTVLERSYSQHDRSLDMHMSRVRRKLVSLGMPAERISTVHGKGYIFS